MARRILGLNRTLDQRSIAAVAYGEIASSIYFALGIVALHALGFTPWILLVLGLLFLVVALSYAEGTAAIPEVGGAAMFVRSAFNDPLGFLTGWALFLDYLIVIAIAALFVPHYLGSAIGWDGIERRPWDVIVGVGIIVTVAIVRLLRRTVVYRLARAIAVAAFASHFLIVVLGFIFLLSFSNLHKGLDLGTAPTWSSFAFALPVAMLAYTGLETVANLAAETREPGRTLPRSLFAGIGLAVAVSFAIALVGLSAYPAHQVAGSDTYTSELGTKWLNAPLVGIVVALDGHLPHGLVHVLQIFLGITGALILVAAVTTSISGSGRLAYSLGQREMLPHAFGVLSRRSLIPPVSTISTAVIASAILVAASAFGKPVQSLASLYSFGVLLTFTAAQVAVIRLRYTQPDLDRPFRVPWNVTIRGTPVPVAALVGAPLTAAIWVVAMLTHDAARVAGPIWMLVGGGVYIAVRVSHGEKLTKKIELAIPDLVPHEEGAYQRILVPVKLGVIGEEVLATAIRLAEENRSVVSAIHVIRVPLELPLDAEMGAEEERARESLADAEQLASEHGIELDCKVVRARSLGDAIVRESIEQRVDLVIMGSAPRWRRQSRFFSPTVDFVLRKAQAEVMVVAYPQGVLEDEA